MTRPIPTDDTRILTVIAALALAAALLRQLGRRLTD